MLEVRDLHKRYGTRAAVDGVSFEVRPGETFGLLGPNGAGKTTTISMIVGTLDPDSGTVTLDGTEVRAANPDIKRRIGYVPQDLALYGDLSARRNLQFFGNLYDIYGQELDVAISRALEATGLTERADEPIKNFSGGMKRRANIAVGILHDPEFLVFDEPTVGVDPQSRNAIFTTLEALAASGKTILYTTHYMEEVERMCSRVAIMDNGKLLADGPIGELHKLLPVVDQVTIEVRGDASHVGGVGNRLSVGMADLSAELPVLLKRLESHGLEIESIASSRPSLEDVFLHLTGTALRD